ncbi:unnamed protein product [Clonostachys solani]|uniref:Major facilitator superfamily (MFS) profile domain-containing protein n=1 Tax=Clonostachys solani TaxID=160281 RepID=A0A9N9ZL37_9HYPO|nr:unnamed protein product [Clonostachys solani]
MGLGVLEYTKLEHVPGTATLNELQAAPDDHDHGTSLRVNLKRDPKSGIILVPQPSDDPNDPYNWPRRKKELFTASFMFGCGAVGAVGPILGPAFVQLSQQFEVSLTIWNIGMQGGLIGCIGLGSLFWNSLAVKYGKRPIYLFTTLGLMVTCFWAAASKSLISLFVSRLFTGFCMAPLEALVPASIADVWFVHERGFRSSLFNLGVLGGINLASVISGPIIEYAGFRATLYAMGGAFGVHLIMAIFWMPETAFARQTQAASNLQTKSSKGKEGSEVHSTVEEVDDATKESGRVAGDIDQASTRPQSWAKSLAPYSGYKSEASFWKHLFQPFIMVVSLPVFWGSVLFSICISWLVGISISLSQIFSAAPYNFSVTAVGAINASSFIASVLGMVIAGPLTDWLGTNLAKRNGGIYEPEFRLPIMAAYLAFTGAGFFAWGQSSYAKDPWPVPVVVCLGMINLGIQLGATGVITYVVDCHRDHASEAIGVMNFIKNMFAFGLVFYLNGWIETQGVRACFFAIGGITVGCCLTAIPMYIFGKRARGWIASKNIIGKHQDME